MKKRGISPLIATVLLVGFVIIVGIIFIIFGGEVIDRQIEDQEEDIDVLTLDINIDLYGYSTDCENVPSWLSVLIDNKGNETSVGFIAKINFEEGFQIIRTNTVLRSHQQGRVYFTGLECNKEITWIEITPIIVSSGKEVIAHWASDQIDAGLEIEDTVGIEKSCVYGGEEGSENIYLYGAYEDNVLSGYLDLEEGSSYSLYVNGDSVQSGTSEQLFLAHFDESMESTNGDTPTDYSIEYLDGKFGGGLGGWVEYDSANNFDLEEGTMEMWLTRRYDVSGDNVFFQYSDSQNLMELKFKPGIRGFQFKHFDYGGVPQVENDSFNFRRYELEYNVPYHFVLSWSVEKNYSYLYIDGQKEISAAYDITGPGTGGEIRVGHDIAIVDEFRIYSRILEDDEVEYIYMRNKPLENNEVYYSGDVSSGDEIKLESISSSLEIYASPKKIESVSPEFHVVSNTNSLDVSFETPSPMVSCRYDYYPKEFLDLGYLANQISDTSYSFNVPVESLVDSVNFYIKCEDICKDDYSFYKRVRVLPEINNNYPKLGNQYWGGGVYDETIGPLSKYDLIILSPGSMLAPGVLGEIRELNPDILIYVYDAPWETGSSQIESYYFSHDKYDIMDDEWRLKDTDGNYVMNLHYPYSEIYNIKVDAYPEYHELAIDSVVDSFLKRGYFDGMFYDNLGHSFWWMKDHESPECNYGQPGSNCYPQPVDMNLDDENEDLNVQADFDMDTEIFRNGLRRIMDISFEKIGPDTLVMLNGAYESEDRSNGKEWEQRLRESTFDGLMDPDYTYGFPYWQMNSNEPRINMNVVDIGNWEDYEQIRYGLVTSLMFDLYFYPSIDGYYRHTFWMDEYAVDLETGIPEISLDKTGYLGEPLGPLEQVDGNGQVLMRKFENGIAIVSNSVSNYVVDLGKYYRSIDGSESPVNDGELKNRVTMSRTDGRILLLPLCSNNPNEDEDCI